MMVMTPHVLTSRTKATSRDGNTVGSKHQPIKHTGHALLSQETQLCALMEGMEGISEFAIYQIMLGWKTYK